MNDFFHDDRLPPHSIDAEACLLGCFILAGDERAIRDEIAERVKPVAFFLRQHAILFGMLVDLHRAGRSIDAIVLLDEMRRTGVYDAVGRSAFIANDILARVPSAAHWREYLARVVETWRLRFVITTGDSLVRAGMAAGADAIETARTAHTKLGQFLARTATNQPPTSPAEDLAIHFDDVIAGRLACLPFPWPALSEMTQALRPGTFTVLAGGVGDSKSLMLLQAFAFLFEKGVRCSAYLLEDCRNFNLLRVLAQLAGRSAATNFEWIRANAAEARRLYAEHVGTLDRIGSRIWDAPRDVPTLAEVAEWIRQRADEGDRIVFVDPISRAKSSERRFVDDEKFVGEISAIAQDRAISVVAVTHPKQTLKTGRPTVNDIAGGAAYSRFAQCIIYLRKLEPAKHVRCVDFQYGAGFDTTVNREALILKARSGIGAGKAIGFTFESASLTFSEKGVISKVKNVESDEEAEVGS